MERCQNASDTRLCGECVACCVYLHISTLEKPPLAHCPHLRLDTPRDEEALYYSVSGEDHCTIYHDRPECCRVYRCAWLDGHGAEQDRPDKCGVLIDTLHRIDGAVEVKPLGEGLGDTEEATGAVLRICRDTGKVGLVTSFGERRWVRAVGRPL